MESGTLCSETFLGPFVVSNDAALNCAGGQVCVGVERARCLRLARLSFHAWVQGPSSSLWSPLSACSLCYRHAPFHAGEQDPSPYNISNSTLLVESAIRILLSSMPEVKDSPCAIRIQDAHGWHLLANLACSMFSQRLSEGFAQDTLAEETTE